jgi:serine/threonine-protein kinase 24/25/MST4
MAKKTSYLTELIERHERWKADGGDKPDDRELARDYDEFVAVSFHLLTILIYVSAAKTTAIRKTSGISAPSVTLGQPSAVLSTTQSPTIMVAETAICLLTL